MIGGKGWMSDKAAKEFHARNYDNHIKAASKNSESLETAIDLVKIIGKDWTYWSKVIRADIARFMRNGTQNGAEKFVKYLLRKMDFEELFNGDSSHYKERYRNAVNFCKELVNGD